MAPLLYTKVSPDGGSADLTWSLDAALPASPNYGPSSSTNAQLTAELLLVAERLREIPLCFGPDSSLPRVDRTSML